ncbi:hypothetical protein ACHAW6_009988 [Cyclotella cf. meneghiniana]
MVAMRERTAPNPHVTNPAGGQENVFSPNLARYLKPEGAVNEASSASIKENNNARQLQSVNHGAKKKKTALSRKNLVVMYPAKHLQSLDDTPDDSINLTQLLFSPTEEKEEVLHSLFSPVGRRRDQQKGKQLNVSKKATTVYRSNANDVDYTGATNHSGDDNARIRSRRADDGHFVNKFETEKENIPPTQHAEHFLHSDRCFSSPTNGKVHSRKNTETTPEQPLDDDGTVSSSSINEFYTPKSQPKTPGTKGPDKITFERIDESISYHSFDTNTLSRENLLSSFIRDECFGEEEKKEEETHCGQRFERKDDQVYEDEESSMVFVTPKQRETASSSRRNEEREASESSDIGDDDDDEEFFSPLAQYPPPSNVCRSSSYEDAAFKRLSMTTNENNNLASQDPLLENGSSYYLINEVKNILAAPKRDSLPVIQDDASTDNDVMDKGIFFSALVQHPPPSSECGSFWTLPHESSFDDLSPIPAQNNNATTVDECPLFEDGSSYNLINDVKSILAASKSDVPRIPPLPFAHSGVQSLACVDSSKLPTKASSEETNISDHEIQPTSMPDIDNIPSIQQTQLTPHLHPVSVSSLPPGALTVDFVKKCECAATLATILSVLSSAKRGKQLRQPSLVRLVKKRLEKVNSQKTVVGKSVEAGGSREDADLNLDNEEMQQEPQWNHFKSGPDWRVTLPPRVAVGRKDSKNTINADATVASNSFQASLLESIMQHPKDDSEFNGADKIDLVMTTPDVVQVVDLPAAPSSSPSIQLSSIAESSLDMNLSESFNLGDESAYWKQIGETTNVAKELSVPEKLTGSAALNMQSRLEVELKRQLEEIQKLYQEAKSDVKRLSTLLEEKQKEASSLDASNLTEIRKETEAARLANRALANALAISEKDLAEAIEHLDKKTLECKHLLSKLNETSDQNAYLSSEIKKLEKELQSCNAYIDSLYAELYQKSPLKNLQAELDRREAEWITLENRYNETIEHLQAELNSQSKSVSMEMYLSMMKLAQQHKLDAAEKHHKIEDLSTMVQSLRHQIDMMQSESSKPGLKSMSTLHNAIRLRQVSPTFQQNDENIKPNQQLWQEAQPVLKQYSTDIGGAKPSYIAPVKTNWEGRKGLSNQL